MKRRDFMAGVAIAAGVTACSREAAGPGAGADRSGERFDWNLVTSWPPGLPGLGRGVQNFANRVDRASGGRLKIKVFAGLYEYWWRSPIDIVRGSYATRALGRPSPPGLPL